MFKFLKKSQYLYFITYQTHADGVSWVSNGTVWLDNKITAKNHIQSFTAIATHFETNQRSRLKTAKDVNVLILSFTRIK